MKPGKHQGSNEKFVLEGSGPCTTICTLGMNFVIKTLLLASPSEVDNYFVLMVKAKNFSKNIQQRNLSAFITISLF